MSEEATSAVLLLRGDILESRHEIDGAIVEAGGTMVACVGDPYRRATMRSAAKPFQALPLVEDGVVESLGIRGEEIAVACGSHGGEPAHLEAVGRLLDRAGVGEDRLGCGPHLPMNMEAAAALLRSGGEAGRIHNNCSGKHAGMLALCRHHGWDLDRYWAPEHPVQRRCGAELARWSGVAESDLPRGVDGCGVVCFALPLDRMALAMARFARAADDGERGPEAILGAMGDHPFMVAGSDRLCTEVIEMTQGGVVAKVGAEGVYCAAVRGRGIGIALKVRDGARRAAEVGLLTALEVVEALDDEARTRLEKRRHQVVRNTRGEPAARLEARLDWRRPAAGGRDSGLPGELRALVDVSAALASGDQGRLAEAMERAGRQATPGALEECLLQAHLFVGFPATLDAFARLGNREAPASVGASEEDRADRLRRGEALCREIYGGAYEGLRSNVRELHPEIDRWMVEDGYGKVLARSGLPVTTRELCIVAILAVQGFPIQLYSHLRGALRVGCPPAWVESTLARSLRSADPDHRRRMLAVWRELASGPGPEPGAVASAPGADINPEPVERDHVR